MIILPLLLATLRLTPTLTAKVATEAVVASPTTTTASEIQKFREVIQEKVKAKLQEIGQTKTADPKRGFFGSITKISTTVINIDTKDKNYQLNITPDTVYLNSKSSKIKVTDLKVGQEIIAIGLLNDSGSLDTKRIVVTTSKEVKNTKVTVFGQIVDKSDMYSLIEMIPSSNKNIQYQIKGDTKNIQILSKDGSKMTIKDITKGKKVIVIFPVNPVTSTPQAAEKIIVM